MKNLWILLPCLAAWTSAFAQEIANPSFETPAMEAPLQVITPGSPGFAEAMPKLQWSFGVQAGICLEGVAYAEGVMAADGHQVAFMQGNFEARDPALHPPSRIFGLDLTGLKPGEEYELSWQQTGRLTDPGSTAVSVTVQAPGETPLSLVAQEPVGAKGKWEKKSVWFVATVPAMRLNLVHHIFGADKAASGDESTLFDDFKIRAGKSGGKRSAK